MKRGSLLALLAALALLVWLSASAVEERAHELPGDTDEAAPSDGEALRGGAEGAPQRPRLSGEAVPPRPPESPEAVTIRVFDRYDHLLPGIGTRWFIDGEGPADGQDGRFMRTNDLGEVVFEPGVALERVTAHVRPPWPNSSWHHKSFPIRSNVQVVRLRSVRKARFHVVDAETGRRLPGAQLRIPKRAGPPFGLQETAPGVFEGQLYIRDGGPRVHARIEVDPPRDYVSWPASDRHAGATLRGYVSAYADRIDGTVPLYPELDFLLEVVDQRDQPVVDARITRVMFAGRQAFQAVDPVRPGPGRIRVTGVPFHRHEAVRVHVRKDLGDDLVAYGRGTVRMPEHSSEPVRLLIRLDPPIPPVEPPSSEGSIGLGGGAGGAFGGRHPHGAVRVRVLRASGAPAIGAKVRADPGGPEVRTDSNGVALLEGVRSGERTVSVHQPGLLPIEPQKVEVLANRVLELTFREPKGGALAIEVVDEADRPLPFVEVHLEGKLKATWTGEMDGVQDMSPYTDVHGRRHLPRVPIGTGSLQLRWGARREVISFEVVEGETTRQRVVLKRTP